MNWKVAFFVMAGVLLILGASVSAREVQYKNRVLDCSDPGSTGTNICRMQHVTVGTCYTMCDEFYGSRCSWSHNARANCRAGCTPNNGCRAV